MTIASAFNEIAVAQGGTASKSGTITGALDALTQGGGGQAVPVAAGTEADYTEFPWQGVKSWDTGTFNQAVYDWTKEAKSRVCIGDMRMTVTDTCMVIVIAHFTSPSKAYKKCLVADFTVQQAAQRAGVSESTARESLKRCIKKGVIERAFKGVPHRYGSGYLLLSNGTPIKHPGPKDSADKSQDGADRTSKATGTKDDESAQHGADKPGYTGTKGGEDARDGADVNPGKHEHSISITEGRAPSKGATPLVTGCLSPSTSKAITASNTPTGSTKADDDESTSPPPGCSAADLRARFAAKEKGGKA